LVQDRARALPLLLAMPSTKRFRGTVDVASTYLTLLAENWDEGLVEIRSEADSAWPFGPRE
jgi:hypothetical protein